MLDRAKVAIDDVVKVISPRHMYVPAHQEIMAAVLALDEANAPTEPVAVSAELERRDALDRVGGAPYVHTLFAEASTPVTAGYYADQVRAAALRRFTAEYANRLLAGLHQSMTTEDLLAHVDGAHSEYSKLLDVGDDQTVTLAGDPAELDALIQRWGTPPESALTTGILDLDDALNVASGSLVVIAARSGVGKSTLAQAISRHYALTRDDGATVFFSMEMSKDELRTRDLAALARIRTDAATGKTPMQPRDWERLEQSRLKLETVPDYHIEHGDMDVAHIRGRLRHHVREHGKLGLVVVDYLGLMKRPGRDREDQELGAITRQLKLMAQEYDTIVMLVAQLNRNPEARVDGKPILSDLRGSGAIEQDADAVIMLHDVAKRDEARFGEVDIILAKQRAGVTGAVVTVADRRAYSDFGDLAKAEM